MVGLDSGPQGKPSIAGGPDALADHGEARSRHTPAVVPGLVPGIQCPSRLTVLPLRGGAFATGGDAMVARRRHALIPMGPGDKRRDDSCAYAAVEKSPPTLCESSRVKPARSEEHTSEIQSLMRISYAVFCLKKKK